MAHGCFCYRFVCRVCLCGLCLRLNVRPAEFLRVLCFLSPSYSSVFRPTPNHRFKSRFVSESKIRSKATSGFPFLTNPNPNPGSNPEFVLHSPGPKDKKSNNNKHQQPRNSCARKTTRWDEAPAATNVRASCSNTGVLMYVGMRSLAATERVRRGRNGG